MPKNIAESGLDPSSTQATIGSELAVSSMEKLDEIESFMAPLLSEAIVRADALLKLRENESISTVTLMSILGWLHNTNTGSPPSTSEVPHPLALSPSPDINESSSKPEKTLTLEKSSASQPDVKTEPSVSQVECQRGISSMRASHTHSFQPRSQIFSSQT